MSKQDRTRSRTPSDTERKFLLNLDKKYAELMGAAIDARKYAESAKAEVDRLKGMTFDAANMTGKVTAAQIDANGLVAENVNISGIVNAISGTIGGWTLEKTMFPTRWEEQENGDPIIEWKEETFLLSEVMTEDIPDSESYYMYATALAPSGVSVISVRVDDGVESDLNVKYKTWRQLLSGE